VNGDAYTPTAEGREGKKGNG